MSDCLHAPQSTNPPSPTTQLAVELEQRLGKMTVSATGRTTAIQSHDKITVGGKYHLEALGAQLLLTTGHVELPRLDSMNLTTASDLNENIAGKRQSMVKEVLSLAVKDKAWSKRYYR